MKAVLARSLGAMRDAGQAITGREVTFCAGVALWIPAFGGGGLWHRLSLRDCPGGCQAERLGTVEIDDSSVDWRDDTGAGQISPTLSVNHRAAGGRECLQATLGHSSLKR